MGNSLWDLLTPCLQENIQVRALQIRKLEYEKSIENIKRADLVARDLYLLTTRVYWNTILELQSELQDTDKRLREFKNDNYGDENERGVAKHREILWRFRHIIMAE